MATGACVGKTWNASKQFCDARDGQIYGYTTIGTQVWMSQNLNFADSTILGATLPTNDAKVEKYCYNDSIANCNTFGGLYTLVEALGLPASCHYPVNPAAWNACKALLQPLPRQGVCPTGWRMPDSTDYSVLKSYVQANGYATNDAVALKTAAYGGVDAFGFSMLIGGVIEANSYNSKGRFGHFWLSNTMTTYIRLSTGADMIDEYTGGREDGYSIRCLKQ